MSRPPAFFLETPVGEGIPRLATDELRHASSVRRLGPGDPIEGIDGEGGRWALEIERKGPGGFLLNPLGDPEHEPRPGEAGARLPWIEVAVGWPKRSRVEGMVGRLVQLGAAAVTPLDAHYRGPEPIPEEVPERWIRAAREALKQSGGSWMPELRASTEIRELLELRAEGTLALLDPEGLPLDTWMRSVAPSIGPAVGLGTRDRPLVLVVGPEGGFDPVERDDFLRAGATPASLGPGLLRVETAAEAAMAVAACCLALPTRL